MVYGAGHKAKRLVLHCINGVSSNSVEGRTKICQLKDLILTLFGLIFRRIYIYIYIFVREAANTNSVIFGLTRPEIEPTILSSTTLDASTIATTRPMRLRPR